MISPKVRTENSDNPNNRGRQPVVTENPVGLRIVDALGERPRSWLARETGVPESTIGDAIVRGPARTEVAVKIADALNLSLDRLLLGIGGSGPELPRDVAGGAPLLVTDDDLVDVVEIDMAYGLGGTFADGPVEVQTHRLARTFVESISHAPASALTIMRGRGDSMRPTIDDGDMVIVDRSQRIVREQDSLWAITVGDIAMVKRLRIRGERVLLLSDNDRVPTDEAHADEVNVVGRVVFIGHRI